MHSVVLLYHRETAAAMVAEASMDEPTFHELTNQHEVVVGISLLIYLPSVRGLRGRGEMAHGSPAISQAAQPHSIEIWLWTDLIAPESERLLKNVVRVHRQEEAYLFYIPISQPSAFSRWRSSNARHFIGLQDECWDDLDEFQGEGVQGPNQVDKVVEDATAETLDEPDLATNLELCDMVNHDRINSIDLIRGIKKGIMLKSPRVQYLAMVLLKTLVKNCEKAFSEVAAEWVLDEMVKLIDDPQTVVNNRNKALTLIEAWGESSDELRYLPVYEETYKSLKSRGIRFPGRDNESLAPIFPPPRSVSASESSPNLAQQLDREIPAQTFSAEQTREAFDVARNSIELLTSVLSSLPQQDALEGFVSELARKIFNLRQKVQVWVKTVVGNGLNTFTLLALSRLGLEID
ncbi:hypothetical protein RHSIM_Rhsim12G0207200 [Rhododendron simsii]|uniref:VHS domain-containing protein n=1 Tax=Rhododendron simsii TaxID=118357 RepID=A0A834L8U2_RHOSS|nr:hypothetical protein RHSIM_Rhsim12G0207200 [Rhododendron simsii]